MLEFKVIDGGKVLVKPQMFYGSVVMDDREERMGAFFLFACYGKASHLFLNPLNALKRRGKRVVICKFIEKFSKYKLLIRATC